jgi:hypothetical protein
MVVQTAASCGNIDPVWMNRSKDTKKEFHLQTGSLSGCSGDAETMYGCESKQLHAICVT